ncbi:MAG: hypothetical protein MI748_05090 [Opitutales bacterium]|nr:hypothetical protein [Opitutales bacterium]
MPPSVELSTLPNMPPKELGAPLLIERNPLGDFTFFADFAIAEWLKPEIDNFDLVKMESVAQSVYGSKPWGYISNRTHATVSNPTSIYNLLQRSCAPKAVAIVTYSLRSRMVAQIEKEHCKTVPLDIFEDLSNACEWMQQQIRVLKEDFSLTAS